MCFPYAASVWCVVAGRFTQDAATTVPPTAATARATRFAAPSRASTSSCTSNCHSSHFHSTLFLSPLLLSGVIILQQSMAQSLQLPVQAPAPPTTPHVHPPLPHSRLAPQHPVKYNRRNNPELEKRRVHHCDFIGKYIYNITRLLLQN